MNLVLVLIRYSVLLIGNVLLSQILSPTVLFKRCLRKRRKLETKQKVRHHLFLRHQASHKFWPPKGTNAQLGGQWHIKDKLAFTLFLSCYILSKALSGSSTCWNRVFFGGKVMLNFIYSIDEFDRSSRHLKRNFDGKCSLSERTSGS